MLAHTINCMALCYGIHDCMVLRYGTCMVCSSKLVCRTSVAHYVAFHTLVPVQGLCAAFTDTRGKMAQEA